MWPRYGVLYYVHVKYVWHFTKTLIRQVYILISGPLRKLSLRPKNTKNLAIHQNIYTNKSNEGEPSVQTADDIGCLYWAMCSLHIRRRSAYRMFVQKTWFICLLVTDGGANYFSFIVYGFFFTRLSNFLFVFVVILLLSCTHLSMISIL